MQFRRGFSVVAVWSLLAICLSCGQNYRLPIIQIPGDPGDPKLYHFAMTISRTDPMINAAIPGSVLQIDVSGDTNAGEANLGRGPVHAMLLPTGAANRIYVANGWEDTVTTTTAAPLQCFPGPVCPIGTVSTLTMPVGSSPSYLASTEAANVYVILSGLNPPTVGVISVNLNTLGPQIALPTGSNPVAMVELPNGHKLYVVDQALNAVYVVDTVSRQIVQTLTTVGTAPSMALASPDNTAVYVLCNNGVFVIDALTDQVLGVVPPTGSTPNSIAYDTKLNRLYVTDLAGGVGIYNAGVAGGTLPTVIEIKPAGFVVGAIAITALPNGNSFYILGNPSGTSLTLTVVDSSTRNAGSTFPLDTLNTGGAPVPAVPQTCGGARFRYMAGASADSSRVYVSSCDAGGTYIFRTTDNTGVLMMPSPLQPPTPPDTSQNPVFLITGR